MHRIIKKPISELGYDFIPEAFLPPGEGQHYLRNMQFGSDDNFRPLRAKEVEILVKNFNHAENWNDIRVTSKFNPELVNNCNFFGFIRIGDMEDCFLEFHDFRHPVGLYNSTIISCDIGNNCVISNVQYLANYIISEECVLTNINEMLTSNYAKFGNGITKAGEEENTRIWIELGNENGGRKVLPFEGMLPQDAYLWSKYRNDEELMSALKTITENRYDSRRGYYGEIGARSIIKNCRVIKDVRTGTDAYIKGANKLKNLTINSSATASTQIGEGVELVNGIIGYGCRVFYGVKAVRFILCDNSCLKYGARLINSLLGENSTISCCEVLNSLIFPGHEQHHNNSFLCAAVIKGQSNLAAGATIGSNHNSRGNDGELIAGRGFWPGLCTSLKHNSRFASFTLMVKGDYPAELDIRLPFSLVSTSETELKILPAYWFAYNMYALARNESKYQSRDGRSDKSITLEFDFLAPDTVSEMISGCRYLEKIVSKCHPASITTFEAAELLSGSDHLGFELFANDAENSRRPVRIMKPNQAFQMYKRMIILYAVLYQKGRPLNPNTINLDKWINLGGQIVSEQGILNLIRNIKNGNLDSWEKIHSQYRLLSDTYAQYKSEHARIIFEELLQSNPGNEEFLVRSALETASLIYSNTVSSRKKDYVDRFRKLPYDNDKEMEAVIGSFDDNKAIRTIHDTTEQWKNIIKDRYPAYSISNKE